jgi:ribokinase
MPSTSSSPRILVVGSINLDLVAQCARLPRPGETVAGRSLREIPGGKGANQAVAAARLGAHVTMIGRVGDDAYGRRLREALIAAGVEVTHVRDMPNCQSGLAAINVDSTGENAIVVIGGANAKLSAADVAASESAFPDAQVLLVQLEVPLDTIVAAVKLARQYHVKVVVDPAPATDSLPNELLAADVICPNETEAARLCGQSVETVEQARAAAAWFCKQGAKIAIVKRGEHGGVVATSAGGEQAFASFPVRAVDTTAAGDAFAGALAVALAENQSLEAALQFASATASIAVTREGAQPAMPTREEVDRLLESSGIRR